MPPGGRDSLTPVRPQACVSRGDGTAVRSVAVIDPQKGIAEGIDIGFVQSFY